MTTTTKALLMLSLALLSQNVVACVMGSVYNLPIPFGMYASGAAGALIASFCVVLSPSVPGPARRARATRSRYVCPIGSLRGWGGQAFSCLRYRLSPDL